MKRMMEPIKTLWYATASHSVYYIDETVLPSEYRIRECTTIGDLGEAIRTLAIRGAPALGVAGAFGVAMSAMRSDPGNFGEFLNQVQSDARYISMTRPTAVNLSWGVNRVLNAIQARNTVKDAQAAGLREALEIAREDAESCQRLGRHGAALLPRNCTVLTHCNAGALACSEWGTALGVIRSAIAEGNQVRVLASETRPLLQGARLTAWELARDGVDVTVITDSMAAMFMRTNKVDCVVVGADRITKDAVLNKIGTYMHAVCAHYHGIPFYVAAPLSTFDMERTEREVEIEERSREEISSCNGKMLVPENVPVNNPAFDATPLTLVSAIITEKGVIRPPFDLVRTLNTPEYRQ